jgi:glutathione synthase/RimK-type ligase-like ATP-grasp enzyme
VSSLGDIALLTERRFAAERAPADDWYFANILRDDALLAEALAEHGLRAQRVDWADPTVDWSRYRAAVFRTTWDYFVRFDEFTAWLRRVEQLTPLINAPETIWWNLDKHYLADLDARGVAAVPSVYLDRGDSRTLAELLQHTGWQEAVVKPCVSGAARNTYRVRASNAAEVEQELAPFRADEAFMFQPFVADIVAGGEITLVVIDGMVTHGVRKVPKAGDFRVQDDHGGSWTEYVPSDEEIAFAERAVAACTPHPLYGRVDLVRGPDRALQLMELELIEPELWLRTHPAAAQRMARAIAESVERTGA